jgi:carbon storage regulator CsrA
MLVLSRKQNERILIGDSIELTVLDVRGTRVKLGIRCPAHIRILRSEVVELSPIAAGPQDELCASRPDDRHIADVPVPGALLSFVSGR